MGLKRLGCLRPCHASTPICNLMRGCSGVPQFLVFRACRRVLAVPSPLHFQWPQPTRRLLCFAWTSARICCRCRQDRVGARFPILRSAARARPSCCVRVRAAARTHLGACHCGICCYLWDLHFPRLGGLMDTGVCLLSKRMRVRAPFGLVVAEILSWQSF